MRALVILAACLFALVQGQQASVFYYITPDGADWWVTAVNQQLTVCATGVTAPSCFVGSVDQSKGCSGTCTLTCSASCSCCNGNWHCGICNPNPVVAGSIVLAPRVSFDKFNGKPGLLNSAIYPGLAFVPVQGCTLQTPSQATFFKVVLSNGGMLATKLNDANPNPPIRFDDLTGTCGEAAKQIVTNNVPNVIVVATLSLGCPPTPIGCELYGDAACSPTDPPLGTGMLCCLQSLGDGYCAYDRVPGVPTAGATNPITSTTVDGRVVKTISVAAYWILEYGNPNN